MAAATAPQPCSPSNFTRATMSRDSCYCTRIMANTRRCWRALKHRAEKKSLRSTLIWKTRRKKLAKWLSRCARATTMSGRFARSGGAVYGGIAPHELAARTDYAYPAHRPRLHAARLQPAHREPDERLWRDQYLYSGARLYLRTESSRNRGRA